MVYLLCVSLESSYNKRQGNNDSWSQEAIKVIKYRDEASHVYDEASQIRENGSECCLDYLLSTKQYVLWLFH